MSKKEIRPGLLVVGLLIFASVFFGRDLFDPWAHTGSVVMRSGTALFFVAMAFGRRTMAGNIFLAVLFAVMVLLLPWLASRSLQYPGDFWRAEGVAILLAIFAMLVMILPALPSPSPRPRKEKISSHASCHQT